MRGILLLNGDPFKEEIDDTNALVVCCDGAYEWAKGRLRIDKNVGDFDSLGYVPEPPPEEIYPAEKDYTDGEIALFKLLESGVDSVEIYGGGGGREDHFLGNLQLLFAARKRCVRASMITERSVFFIESGVIPLNGIKGKTLSVFPFGDEVHIMGSKGLKYTYPPKLALGECRGVSNVAESDVAELRTGEGEYALIIINRGAV